MTGTLRREVVSLYQPDELEGRIEKTRGAVYSLAGDTADAGMDDQTPVTDDYDEWDNTFTGTIHTVKVSHKEGG